MDKKELIFESNLSYAAKVLMEIEVKEAEKYVEYLEPFEVSKRFLKKKEKLLRKVENRELWRTQYLPLKRVAACLIVLFFVMGACFATVDAVQQAVIKTVIEWYETFTRIVFKVEQPEMSLSLDNVEVGYWPSGYDDIRVNEILPFSYTYACRNGLNKITFLKIKRIETQYDILLDNEFTGYKQFSLGEKDALLGSDTEGTNVLVWTERGYLIRISSPETVNEIVKIAENLIF